MPPSCSGWKVWRSQLSPYWAFWAMSSGEPTLYGESCVDDNFRHVLGIFLKSYKVSHLIVVGAHNCRHPQPPGHRHWMSHLVLAGSQLTIVARLEQFGQRYQVNYRVLAKRCGAHNFRHSRLATQRPQVSHLVLALTTLATPRPLHVQLMSAVVEPLFLAGRCGAHKYRPTIGIPAALPTLSGEPSLCVAHNCRLVPVGAGKTEAHNCRNPRRWQIKKY